MKNLRRRLQNLSPSWLIALALLPLLSCALLNGRYSFDLMWIIVTGGGAFLVTFLILAPKLLPIAGTPEESTRARRLFFDFMPAFRRSWRELRLRVSGRFVTEWRTPRRWSLDAETPFEQVRVLATPMRAQAMSAARAETAPPTSEFSPQKVSVSARVSAMFAMK